MSDSTNLEEYDSKTKQLLAQGMSAAAAQASMGLANGVDPQLRETMLREQKELADDMTRKNAEVQKRRARLLAGEPTGDIRVPPSEVEQKPVKRRGKRGMVRQEPAQVNLPETPHTDFRPIAPAIPLPEQPEPSAPGQDSSLSLTAGDIELINMVKNSRERSRDTFLEHHDTIHPGAVDMRRMPQPIQEPAPYMVGPELRPSDFAANSPLRQREPVSSMNAPMQSNLPIQQSMNQSRLQAQGPIAARPLPPHLAQEFPAYRPAAIEPGAMPAPRAFPELPEAERRAEYPAEPVPVEPVPPAQEPQAVQTPAAPNRAQAGLVLPRVMGFDPCRPDRNFEVFTEVSGWPSHGLFYTGNVFAQALQTVDAFMLSEVDEDDITSVLSTVISRRVRGVSPEDILTCDEEFLMYWLRASSYPEQNYGLPRVRFECPHCHRKYHDAESLSMVESPSFSYMSFVMDGSPEEVAAKHMQNGCVTYDLCDGRVCNIYLRRRKHDRISEEYVHGWENANRMAFPKWKRKALNLAVIVEIEDCETISDKIDYIEKYPLYAKRDFMQAVLDAQMTVKTMVTLKCPRCGGAASVPYPFRYFEFVASL